RAAGDKCSQDSDCVCDDGFTAKCHDNSCRCRHHGHHPNNHAGRAAGDSCSANSDCDCPHGFVAHCRDSICRCHHDGHVTHHPHTHLPDNHHPNSHAGRAAGDSCSVNSDCDCPHGFVADCRDSICRCHHDGHVTHHPHTHHPDNHHPNSHAGRAAGDSCSVNSDCDCPHGFVADCKDSICRCHHDGHVTHHPHTHHPDNHHPNSHAGRAAGDSCSVNSDCDCPHGFVADCKDSICRCHHYGHVTHHPHTHPPDNHHPNNHAARAAGDSCQHNSDCTCNDGFTAQCHDNSCRCHHHGHHPLRR
ncbi:hypothetical protein LOTGIDRAFT_177037, partial [Lottia gigantea]